MIGTLGELAAMPGMPSEPTLKKLLAEHDDFPVLKRGDRGVGYEFDLGAAFQFVRDLHARDEEAARQRASQVRQFGLDLLGGESLSVPAEVGLSPAERKALLEEELFAIKVAVQRGKLIDKASIEQAFGAFLVKLDQQRRSFTGRLIKRAEFTREQLAVIEAVMTSDQIALSTDMERLADQATIAAAEDGEDDASTDRTDPADGNGV